MPYFQLPSAICIALNLTYRSRPLKFCISNRKYNLMLPAKICRNGKLVSSAFRSCRDRRCRRWRRRYRRWSLPRSDRRPVCRDPSKRGRLESRSTTPPGSPDSSVSCPEPSWRGPDFPLCKKRIKC